MAGRILIADAVATNRIVLRVKLVSAFYEVIQARTGEDALQQARDKAPDLIILDAGLPDLDGPNFCMRLRALPATANIPVIILTRQQDQGVRLAALRAGADDFLTKPVDELMLLARMRSLLRARSTTDELRRRQATARELGFAETAKAFELAGHVALVAPDARTARHWADQLRPLLAHQVEPLVETQVLEHLQRGEAPADCYVIAANMAQAGSGLRLLSDLRSRTASRHAAVIMVNPPDDRNGSVMSLDLGANDMVTADFDPRELALRIATQLTRKRETDRLRHTVEDGFRLAAIDPLTGLYNRRYALPHLDDIAAQSAQSGRSFAVMLLDLDRFKTVNDIFGHAAGDAVLVEVALRLKRHLRTVDMVARMGGEEFLVVMPDTSLPRARVAAERLRRVMEETPVRLKDGDRSISVTLSIGLSIGGRGTGLPEPIDQLLEDADRALLTCKSDGRNQVRMGATAA